MTTHARGAADPLHDRAALRLAEVAVLGAGDPKAGDLDAKPLRRALRHARAPAQQEDLPAASGGAPQDGVVEVAAVEDRGHPDVPPARRDADPEAVRQAQARAGERGSERRDRGRRG